MLCTSEVKTVRKKTNKTNMQHPTPFSSQELHPINRNKNNNNSKSSYNETYNHQQHQKRSSINSSTSSYQSSIPQQVFCNELIGHDTRKYAFYESYPGSLLDRIDPNGFFHGKVRLKYDIQNQQPVEYCGLYGNSVTFPWSNNNVQKFHDWKHNHIKREWMGLKGRRENGAELKYKKRLKTQLTKAQILPLDYHGPWPYHVKRSELNNRAMFGGFHHSNFYDSDYSTNVGSLVVVDEDVARSQQSDEITNGIYSTQNQNESDQDVDINNNDETDGDDDQKQDILLNNNANSNYNTNEINGDNQRDPLMFASFFNQSEASQNETTNHDIEILDIDDEYNADQDYLFQAMYGLNKVEKDGLNHNQSSKSMDSMNNNFNSTSSQIDEKSTCYQHQFILNINDDRSNYVNHGGSRRDSAISTIAVYNPSDDEDEILMDQHKMNIDDEIINNSFKNDIFAHGNNDNLQEMEMDQPMINLNENIHHNGNNDANSSEPNEYIDHDDELFEESNNIQIDDNNDFQQIDDMDINQSVSKHSSNSLQQQSINDELQSDYDNDNTDNLLLQCSQSLYPDDSPKPQPILINNNNKSKPLIYNDTINHHSIKSISLTPINLRNDKFCELDENDYEIIQKVFNLSSNTKIGRHMIEVKDLATLKPGQWLTGEVMNVYMALLQDRNIQRCQENPKHCRVLLMRTYFYTKLTSSGYDYKSVKRWTNKAKLLKKGFKNISNIFQLDKLIFPVHVNNMHWCCGVVDFKSKTISYFDSMNGPSSSFFNIITKYIIDEFQDKLKDDKTKYKLDLKQWKQENHRGKYPQQKNGFDCGVFTAKCADWISDGLYPDYSQQNMQYFRNRMMIEIIRGKTLNL